MTINKIIFALSFVICLTISCQNISAQNARKKPKPVSKTEIERRAVKKFVDSFIKSFDEAKDLNSILNDFFVEDFKFHQTQSPYKFLDYDDELKKLSIDEQFKHQITLLNFSYLMMMWNGGSENFILIDNEDNKDEEVTPEKILPPDVIEALTKSKILATMFDFEKEDEYDKEKLTPNDLSEATVAMQYAGSLLKIAIENRENIWKKLFAKNIKKARKRFTGYETKSCKGNECFGFPEKTRFHFQAVFPFYLGLVKEKGKLKIFYITIYDE